MDESEVRVEAIHAGDYKAFARAIRPELESHSTADLKIMDGILASRFPHATWTRKIVNEVIASRG